MESFDIVCCFWGWFSLLLLFVELTEVDVDISAKSAKKLFWLLEDVAVVVLPFPVPFWLVVDGPTKSLNSCPPPDVESIINYGHVMYFLGKSPLQAGITSELKTGWALKHALWGLTWRFSHELRKKNRKKKIFWHGEKKFSDLWNFSDKVTFS